MQNELQRVLNLAKKTGDRVIVFDHNEPKNTYVVMGLDEYERMAEKSPSVEGLTEGELLDKINDDIAQWKNRGDFNILESSDAEAMEDKATTAKAQGVKQEDIKMEAAKPVKKSNWSIPKTVKEAAEEVMEEDKQYLEEVSF